MVGADAKDIKKQRHNLSIATGMGLRKGASATIVIEWTYGRGAQPDVQVHLSHIEAWLRYYDMYKKVESDLIGRSWKETLKRTEEAGRQGREESSEMRSAMSACMVSLR